MQKNDWKLVIEEDLTWNITLFGENYVIIQIKENIRRLALGQLWLYAKIKIHSVAILELY